MARVVQEVLLVVVPGVVLEMMADFVDGKLLFVHFVERLQEKLDQWLKDQMRYMSVRTAQTYVKTSLNKSEEGLVHRSRCSHQFSRHARLMSI